MTKADKITALRLFLAPVFFIVYFLPVWFSLGYAAWTVPVLWSLFIVSELTDMLDGMVARRMKEVNDFGKLFDPFADTLMQITCFLCFVIDRIFPAALFLVVLYREFGILFLRNLMLKKGIAMGARLSGKAKTVAYIIAGIVALAVSSIERLGLDTPLSPFRLSAAVLFTLSVFLAVFSFFDYLRIYRKAVKA